MSGPAVLLLAALLLVPGVASAKGRGHQRTARARTSAPVERSARAERPAPPSDQGESASGGGESDSPAPPTSSAPSPGKTSDGKTIKTKTYTFGAMDVEGKLKTPQLLYFLNRVKLELDMSAPDKRSFMKELVKSADDKNL